MVACLCGGIAEIGLIATIVSWAITFWWNRKLDNAR